MTKQEKRDFVQLKVRVPKFIKAELKAEAAHLSMPLEDYLLFIFTKRKKARKKA